MYVTAFVPPNTPSQIDFSQYIVHTQLAPMETQLLVCKQSNKTHLKYKAENLHICETFFHQKKYMRI